MDTLLYLSPDFKILDANEAHQRAAMKTREEMVGRYLFEVFPDNPEDARSYGTHSLRESLKRVKTTLKTDIMDVYRYDIQGPEGTWEIKFWQATNIPILDHNGKLDHIVQKVSDVTEKEFKARERKRQRTYFFQNAFVALVAILFTFVAAGFWINPDALDSTLGPVHPYDYYWNGFYLIGGISVLVGFFSRRTSIEAAGHILFVPGLILNFLVAAAALGFHVSTFLTVIFAVAAAGRAVGLIEGWQSDKDDD